MYKHDLDNLVLKKILWIEYVNQNPQEQALLFQNALFFRFLRPKFALSIPNKTKTHMITIKVATVHFMEFPGFFN